MTDHLAISAALLENNDFLDAAAEAESALLEADRYNSYLTAARYAGVAVIRTGNLEQLEGYRAALAETSTRFPDTPPVVRKPQKANVELQWSYEVAQLYGCEASRPLVDDALGTLEGLRPEERRLSSSYLGSLFLEVHLQCPWTKKRSAR